LSIKAYYFDRYYEIEINDSEFICKDGLNYFLDYSIGGEIENEN
jgi:hypothetical protein